MSSLLQNGVVGSSSDHHAEQHVTTNDAAQEKVIDVLDGHVDDKVLEREETPAMKKIADWPLRGIKEPHDNDVLFGRGGGTNHHPGNKRYRKMVEDRKLEYVDAKRLDKPLVALDIIKIWRAQVPSGRFLKLDEKTSLWSDVGDKKAREKTSQALREKAPLVRKQNDGEKRRSDDDDGYDDDDYGDEDYRRSNGKPKNTRFAEGTNLEGRDGSKKPVLARDHSLGREILDEGEPVTLDGFSWQDPFPNGRQHSHGSAASDRVPSGGPAPSVPYPHDARYPSYGGGPPPPPPPPGAYGPMGSDRYPSGRFESWGSNYSMPPPPMPGYGYPPPPHGSWTQRDHSLGRNPLPYTNVGQAAPAPYFDSRHGSWSRPANSWGPPPPPDGRYESWGSQYSGSWGPPPPHYHDGRAGSYGPPNMPPYGPPPYHHHSGSRPPPAAPAMPPPPSRGPPRPVPGAMPRSPAPSASPSPPKAPPSPLYSVDPKVASKWSGKDEGEIQKSLSGDSNTSEEVDRFDATFRKQAARIVIDARPDLIKRATSNQNETLETKPDLKGPSVKRAALNRDSSAAANRLKEQYIPGFQKRTFNAEREVRALSQNLEQSWPGVRPDPFTESERMSTIDSIAMELIVKPVVFSNAARSSTIEALDLDLDDDTLSSANVKPKSLSRSRTMEEVLNDWKADILKDYVPKPDALSGDDRLTTNDYLTIIKEPLDDEGLSGDEMTLGQPSVLSRETSLSERWVTGTTACD